jgi:paraquat-inducible protein A
MQGQVTQATLMTAVRNLAEQGKAAVAAVLFFTSILAPALPLLLLLAVLAPLNLRGRLPPGFPTLFRSFRTAAHCTRSPKPPRAGPWWMSMW